MTIVPESSALGGHAHALPVGFKQTELGMMPNDWEVYECGDVCIKIQDGTHFSPKLGGTDYLYVTSRNIGPGILDVSNAERISEMEHRKIYSRCDTLRGDLLLTKDGANTGNAAINHLDEECSLLSSVAFLRFDTMRHDARFYLQYILSAEGQQQIQNMMSGNAITRLTLAKIRQLRVPSPPFPEQHAIAEALSDVDGLLGALGALIAKKRAIKQASMQQLLTGRTRLPGFSGEWETVVLGNHVTFLRHGVHARAELSTEGVVKYLHYGDIHTSTNVRLNPRITPVPSLSEQRARALDRLRDGDLVLVDASEDLEGVGKSVEIAGAADTEIVSGLHTIAARFDKRVLADGFKAYLQFCPAFRDQLKRLAAGTKVFATNRAHVASVEIRLPSTEEQTAMATVLSDMDAEIAALERRRDKTRDIKHGMIQQLLAGRVRLWESGPPKKAVC